MNYRCYGMGAALGLLLCAQAAAESAQPADVLKSLPPGTEPIVAYIVPPLSPVKYLPDRIPDGGSAGNELNLIAAGGEFEPASFMLFSRRDIDGLQAEVSDLQGGGGAIPRSNISLRVVKCWYQGGTAWNSYFADPTKKEFIPELLLNDETLIKVDPQTRDNYLRVDFPGRSEYRWISYMTKNDPGYFSHDNMPVSDAAELRPVKLTAGEGKQFWLTVNVPPDTAPGNYTGTVTLTAAGKKEGALTVKLRVLPFNLPEPATYYDPAAKFYVSLYNHSVLTERLALNGNDLKKAERKLAADYANMHEHGCDYPLVRVHGRLTADAGTLTRAFELVKESPLKKDVIFGGLKITDWYTMVQKPEQRKPDAWDNYVRQIDHDLEIFRRVFGHGNLYGIGWDEPSVTILKGQRRGWKYLQPKGVKIMQTSKDKHLVPAGYNQDFSNYGGSVAPEAVRRWHAMGSKVTIYAMPHTGPENPAFIRRTHGIMPYKADLDGTCNYIYHEAVNNIWNDFATDTFRCFNLVYPTRDNVIDTIAWEGFREGVDDIRYATKLRQLAAEGVLAKNPDTVYTARKALQWLALADEKNIDLDTMRLEMINHIMKIHHALEGEKK